MTAAQFELASLILKGLFIAGERIVDANARLKVVGGMTDEQCLAAIPVVQQNIDRNDDIIKGL